MRGIISGEVGLAGVRGIISEAGVLGIISELAGVAGSTILLLVIYKKNVNLHHTTINTFFMLFLISD